MEVTAEAKRIMVVALGKLYSSRTQRGGLRLHRSLLLTLVMKSARDRYHEAQHEAQQEEERVAAAAGCGLQEETEELLQGAPELCKTQDSRGQDLELCRGQDLEDKENLVPAQQPSRKRRGKAAVEPEPDFLPCKKAKLDCPQQQQQLLVASVLLDYVLCSSELGGPTQTPIPLQRAVAAC
ncbi:immediate early response gene 2 protein [Sebastes fasciatus]|uniref:immediate early response gene 2 protein n=1 Tax=Sebastes fasciatus TaxID=394691 RepID=UPI003D9EF0E0